jgi:HPt (histidine-containing phosphotransfer) domain-containing protein
MLDQLSKLRGCQFHEVLEMIGGDLSLLFELIMMLDQEFSGLSQEIERCLLTREVDGLKSSLHALKGSAANLGLVELAALAAELEASIKEGRFCDRVAHRLVLWLRNDLKVVNHTIGELLEQSSSG